MLAITITIANIVMKSYKVINYFKFFRKGIAFPGKGIIIYGKEKIWLYS